MKCSHQHTKTTLTPEMSHHGRVDCADCGSFVRWLPKPENVERAKQTAKIVGALNHDDLPLSDWERGFVKSLSQQGNKLSPKQREKLEALARKFHL